MHPPLLRLCWLRADSRGLVQAVSASRQTSNPQVRGTAAWADSLLV